MYAHDVLLTANFDWNYIEVDKYPLVNLYYFVKPSKQAIEAGYNIKKFVEVNRYNHAWFKIWHFTGQKAADEKSLFNFKSLFRYPGYNNHNKQKKIYQSSFENCFRDGEVNEEVKEKQRFKSEYYETNLLDAIWTVACILFENSSKYLMDR